MKEVFDFFSGCGQMSYGLEKAGFETIAFCEKDRDCQYILSREYPGKYIFPDITTLATKKDAVIDQMNYQRIKSIAKIAAGGYPCIGHSIAGKKEGLKNEESRLWKQYKRVLKDLKPEWIIIENSPNLKKTGLVEVVRDLLEIGYMGEAHIFSSCSFGGISRRERLYIIANNNGLRLFDETFTQEKKEQIGWSERRASVSSQWANQSEPGRIYSGYTEGLDEIERQKRIRICGNSLDWRIPYFIGLRLKQVIEENKK